MFPDYLDVPIFPLPSTTLFPGSLLPLHVFEPRYLAMTGQCLAGDRLMAVALLREGWQKDYFGRPPIHRTFGVGRIVDHVSRADGAIDIILEGLHRVRLIEEHDGAPFRVGHVEVIRDRALDDRRGELAGVLRELSEACRLLGEALPQYREAIQAAWSAHPHPAYKADLLAAHLVCDLYDRQSILEQDDPLRRLKLVLVQVRRILHQFTPPRPSTVCEED